jgi:plastocyanin domain-containing protein
MVALGSACTGSSEKESVNTIKMSVTEQGFEPAQITVKKGQPVNLVVTRTFDGTCATEIVIDEYQVHAALPLNQPVTVAFTPTESGEIKYGCGMDKMIGGVLRVE